MGFLNYDKKYGIFRSVSLEHLKVEHKPLISEQFHYYSTLWCLINMSPIIFNKISAYLSKSELRNSTLYSFEDGKSGSDRAKRI